MRLLQSSALISFVLTSCFLTGCSEETTPSQPDPARSSTVADQPIAPPSVTAARSTQESITKARDILTEVGRIYREAPTLTDAVTLTYQSQPQTMHVRFDVNNERISMSLPSAAAYVIEGTLYMTTSVMYDVYYEKSLAEQDARTAIADIGWVPPYHFAMRLSDDVDSYLPGLTLGVLRDPRIRDYQMITDEDGGSEYHVITLDAAQGAAHVFVDAESMFVTHIMMEILPGRNQPATAPRTSALAEAEVILADNLADPIVFDKRDRRAVSNPEELTPRPLLAGDLAPDFALQTLEGETVRLSDLRGQVVVLDFWATWCVPCIMAMPYFDRFSKWAEEDNKPIKAFAVNTMEQAPTAAQRRELAVNFWSEHDFTVPVLFDADNKVVMRYGYVSIPMTVVIGPDGRITKTHDQFSRNMFQILKTAAERALE